MPKKYIVRLSADERHHLQSVIKQLSGSSQKVRRAQVTIQLAYYPPYHSKYNPVERTFGWLEQHWRGRLLDSVETVTRFAESLTFKGKHPTVNLVTQTYNTGIKLTQRAMAELENSLHRLPGLEKWFVEIVPTLAS